MNKLGISVLLIGFTAFNASAADRTISYADFVKEMKSFSSAMKGANNCSFNAITSPWDLAVQVTVGNDSVEVSANERSKILVSQKSTMDGSYAKKYNIDGVGVLVLTHADDAYDTASLTFKGKTLNCAVEY